MVLILVARLKFEKAYKAVVRHCLWLIILCVYKFAIKMVLCICSYMLLVDSGLAIMSEVVSM
jgi:hypothetical protein